MNIFVSWSGEKSKRVAIALKELIQQIDKRNTPWFSDRDMLAGGQWRNELMYRLRDSHFGILCITQTALQSSWLLFEAGALGAGVFDGRVCPYLIDVDKNNLSEPLALFQSKGSTKEESRDLIKSINYAMKDNALPEHELDIRFETFWPEFELLLQEINRDFVPLPTQLRRRLLDMLSYTLDFEEARMSARISNISAKLINWNQALYYVLEDILRVAIDERKLGVFIEVISEQRPNVSEVQELRYEVHKWENPTVDDEGMVLDEDVSNSDSVMIDITTLEPNPYSTNNSQLLSINQMDITGLNALCRKIIRYSSLNDVKALVFDLNIDYDNLAGKSKSEKVFELIAYLQRRNHISDLLNILRRNRPDVEWP